MGRPVRASTWPQSRGGRRCDVCLFQRRSRARGGFADQRRAGELRSDPSGRDAAQAKRRGGQGPAYEFREHQEETPPLR